MAGDSNLHGFGEVPAAGAPVTSGAGAPSGVGAPSPSGAPAPSATGAPIPPSADFQAHPIPSAHGQPAAATAFPGFSFAEGVHNRVHKSYIFLGPTMMFAAFLLVLVNSSSGMFQLISEIMRQVDGPSVVMIVLVVVALFLLVYGILLGLYAISYKRISYVFGAKEFSVYSGVIVKKRVHVPYERVQSVNHRAGVLQRIAGVCTVSIDTAGGAQNKAVRIPYVTLTDAERIRADLFMRKAFVASASVAGGQPAGSSSAAAGAVGSGADVTGAGNGAGGPDAGVAGAPGWPAAPNVLDATVGEVADWRGLFGGEVAGLEPVTCEMGLSNKELLLTSISHAAPFVVAIIVALTMFASLLPLAFVAGAGVALGMFFIALVTVASALVSWVFASAGMAIMYGKFRVRRRGSRVEVERGLLQRNFSGIDVSRIQSVEIRQTFVRRLIGYCEISLGRISTSQDTSGSSSNKQEKGLVIHPFVKVDHARDIVNELLPEFQDMPAREQLKALPPVARRRCLLRRCLWYNVGFYVTLAMLAVLLVMLAIGEVMRPLVPAWLGLTGIVAAVCAAITVVLAVNAVIHARESGYGWNRDFITVCNAGFRTSLVSIPRQKVQDGATRTNPFQRRLLLTSLVVTTAAGSGKTVTRLVDVPQAAGDDWLSWLEPRKRHGDDASYPEALGERELKSIL